MLEAHCCKVNELHEAMDCSLSALSSLRQSLQLGSLRTGSFRLCPCRRCLLLSLLLGLQDTDIMCLDERTWHSAGQDVQASCIMQPV